MPCTDCDGQRFSDEVLAARADFAGRQLSIADVLNLTVAEVRPILSNETYLSSSDRLAAQRILAALEDIGLGYLALGQPSPTLSGGEAQRVKLAKYLGQRSLASQLLVLDEPSTGLHPQDLAGLLAVLDRLVQAGATVLVVEHNTDFIRAADWIIDLGPGAGPRGGRLLYAGPPEGVMESEESLTGRALREEDKLSVPFFPSSHLTYPPAPSLSVNREGRGEATGFTPSPFTARGTGGEVRTGGEVGIKPPVISIRGARTHNLQGVDVDFPKAALTVVTGVSGSGKSSLVSDVLEAEARRRFLETLSLYERQGTHEGPEAEVESVSGLGVALAVAPERLVYARRATVGTATEIVHHLAVLLSAAGQRACLQCGAALPTGGEACSCPVCGTAAVQVRPQHFSSLNYAAACLKCNGVGTLTVPRPDKLIIHPEKPLTAGAMYSPGFFPDGYLGKPFNGGYYLVQALAQRYGFDPQATPWNEMSPEARQAFLFGDPEPMLVRYESRTGRTNNTHMAPFPGFYGFIRDWDVGGTYTEAAPCPACGGARLRPEYLAVTLAGFNCHQLGQMPLRQLASVLAQIDLPVGVPRLAGGSLGTARRRLAFLCQVGLGYLNLDRVAGTLSAGEVQRIRLAGLLGSGSDLPDPPAG